MCCGGKQTIMQTIKHGVIGLGKVVFRIDIADKVIIQQRRDICRFCEFAGKNKDRLDRDTKGLTSWSMCSKCHCNIEAKTQLTTEHCPENKWN
jgi:hypothetical protein